jgi:hypothetical protein
MRINFKVSSTFDFMLLLSVKRYLWGIPSYFRYILSYCWCRENVFWRVILLKGWKFVENFCGVHRLSICVSNFRSVPPLNDVVYSAASTCFWLHIPPYVSENILFYLFYICQRVYAVYRQSISMIVYLYICKWMRSFVFTHTTHIRAVERRYIVRR